jgi:hypothetical protein
MDRVSLDVVLALQFSPTSSDSSLDLCDSLSSCDLGGKSKKHRATSSGSMGMAFRVLALCDCGKFFRAYYIPVSI